MVDEATRQTIRFQCPCQLSECRYMKMSPAAQDRECRAPALAGASGRSSLAATLAHNDFNYVSVTATA